MNTNSPDSLLEDAAVSPGPPRSGRGHAMCPASPSPETWTWSWFSRNLGGGSWGPNYKSLITLLFLKRLLAHFSPTFTMDTHSQKKKKIPSFSHTSKADVTFFMLRKRRHLNTGHDVRRGSRGLSCTVAWTTISVSMSFLLCTILSSSQLGFTPS